jgi:hypothetical protein
MRSAISFEDRRVGPVLRAPGTVELEPRAGYGGLGVLGRIGVAIEMGKNDRLRCDAEGV